MRCHPPGAESDCRVFEGLLPPILDPTATPEEVSTAVNALADLCTSIVALDHGPPCVSPEGTELRLSSGTAISPRDAAMCMRDFQRTAQFCRGIRAGLDELLGTVASRPLRVVYAGCGPFATLVLPLLPRYAPEEVLFHLWDVHETSLVCVHRLLERLGLHGGTAEYWSGDASQREIQGDPPHMVIVEAMQAALEKEPQVAITANLAPQLAPGGLLVPEQIRLVATMLDPGRAFDTFPRDVGDRGLQDVGIAFELDRDAACRISALRAAGRWPEGGVPGARIHVPATTPATSDLWIRTEIDVFGPFGLRDDDSGLTVLRPAPQNARPDTAVRFAYEIGETPGLRASLEHA